MEGTKVWTRGGPSFLGWRKKRNDYELWATDRGAEVVKRAGTHVWGVRLPQ